MVSVLYALLADKVENHGDHQTITGAPIVYVRPEHSHAVLPRITAAIALLVPFEEIATPLTVLFNIVNVAGVSILADVPGVPGTRIEPDKAPSEIAGKPQHFVVSQHFEELAYPGPGIYGSVLASTVSR